jgi:hypothetical protein
VQTEALLRFSGRLAERLDQLGGMPEQLSVQRLRSMQILMFSARRRADDD